MKSVHPEIIKMPFRLMLRRRGADSATPQVSSAQTVSVSSARPLLSADFQARMILISVIVLAIYGVAVCLADPAKRDVTSAALGFQVACWLAALFLIGRRRGKDCLRFSNPALVVLLWCGAYFLYPSFTWLLSGPTYWGIVTDEQVIVSLFWLHGFFMIAFAIAYKLVNPAPFRVDSVDVQRLPSGWLLFGISWVPLVISVLSRVVGGGGLVPKQNYGDVWYEGRRAIEAARAMGGVAYLKVQISSKTYLYPEMACGIGAGLVLCHTRYKRAWPRWRIYGLIVASLSLRYILGSGTRSPVVMILIMMLILANSLGRRISWARIVLLLGAAMLISNVQGIYRTLRSEGFTSSVVETWETLRRGKGSSWHVDEFAGMLYKEHIGVQIFGQSRPEGPMYMVRNLLNVVPSQLLPQKLKWTGTASVIIREHLGPSAEKEGRGTAGAAIVDGYRVHRWLGVPFVAAILGVTIGLLQSWVMKKKHGQRTPDLIRVCLFAAFCSWLMLVVRSESSQLVSRIGYYVALPFFVVWFWQLVFGCPGGRWFRPVPTIVWKRRGQSAKNRTELEKGYE